MDDPGAGGVGDFNGSVRGATIDHDDFVGAGA
jgi:hypothetical protein